jgi:hypothetical protein
LPSPPFNREGRVSNHLSSARFNRRPTLNENEISAARRRSFEVGGGEKSISFGDEDDGEKGSKKSSGWRQRRTMFNVEASIEEEEDDDSGKERPLHLPITCRKPVVVDG